MVERQQLTPQRLPEHYIAGHGLTIAMGDRPVRFSWKDGPRTQRRMFNPGEFHLLTRGEPNTPGWSDPFDELSLVLDQRFVSDIVGDASPADIEFRTQRSALDPIIARYAGAYCSELSTGCPNGPLYAETLTVGLTLHLLSHFAVAKPGIPDVRAKLSAAQLCSIVDFVQAHLRDKMPIRMLAEQARVSPSHFARQFRATVGLAPHQFVLTQRVHRSARLLRSGKLTLAAIAVDCGFHDQPHFTKAFRTVFGTTPLAYAAAHRPRSN